MRKAEKKELARVNYGLSLGQCPTHHVPLERHEIEFWEGIPEARRPEGWEHDVEGCWDCPVDGCDCHVPEVLTGG